MLIGAATGLKLVEGFYAVGFALVLLLLPGRPAVRTARLLAGGAAGIAAVVLCAGLWFLTLERATGSRIDAKPYLAYLRAKYSAGVAA